MLRVSRMSHAVISAVYKLVAAVVHCIGCMIIAGAVAAISAAALRCLLAD
jgi:hypothetical protein